MLTIETVLIFETVLIIENIYGMRVRLRANLNISYSERFRATRSLSRGFSLLSGYIFIEFTCFRYQISLRSQIFSEELT